jgi:hypothetical protein
MLGGASDRIEKFLYESWRLNLAGASVFGIAFWVLFWFSGFLAVNNPFGNALIGVKSALILFLIAAGFLRPLLSSARFAIFAWGGSFLVINYVPSVSLTLASSATGMALTFLPGLALIWLCRRGLNVPLGMSALIGATLAVMTLLTMQGRIHADDFGWWFFRPERYFMVVTIALASIRARGLPGEFVNPIHSLYPLPLFSHEWVEDHGVRTRASGIVMILAAIAAFLGAGLVHPLMEDLRLEHEIGPSLICGFFTFIYFYLNSWAALNLVVGLLRWWGWQVPAPFRFALLAVSPQDSWRRWNIPFYHWFRNLIFLPLLRRTGSVWFGVGAAFAMSFFLHDGFDMAQWLIGDETAAVVSHLRNKAFFFGLHGAAVAGGISLRRFWPDARRLSGWIGVAITWITLSAIHWWVRFY